MLKTIATFNTEIDAELIKGILNSSGIESFVFKDDCGGMRPHMQLTDGVRLKVADIDFEVAMDILNSDNKEIQQEDIDESEDVKIINELLRRARGWILVGFAIIPSLISFPISFIYTIKAAKKYDESDINDYKLKKLILRLQFTSVFFSILFWTVAIFYTII